MTNKSIANLGILLKQLVASFQFKAKDKNINFKAKINNIPKAYFDERNDVVPLRFIAFFSNKLVAYRYFEKILDINSSWFQKPIIGCEDCEDLGYTQGSCKSSEFIAEQIINFPSVHEVGDAKELMIKLNSFLSLKNN